MKFLKVIAVNLLSIALILFLLFTITSMILNNVTRHGESLTVPDIRGLKLDAATKLLAEKHLRFVISDSLYFEDKPKSSILEQDPAPQSKVKEGRIVYLTINSNTAPLIAMPNLIDVSLRQAQVMLQSVGLKAGQLIYKPDIAQNVVLDQLYRGHSVQPGTKVPKGSDITIVLGSGMGGESEVSLPDLIGLTKEEADNLLISSSLNMGSVIYLGKITDTVSAKIVRQTPAFDDGVMVKPGQSVDIYLKQE